MNLTNQDRHEDTVHRDESHFAEMNHLKCESERRTMTLLKGIDSEPDEQTAVK